MCHEQSSFTSSSSSARLPWTPSSCSTSPKMAAEWLAFLLIILEVTGSILGREQDIPCSFVALLSHSRQMLGDQRAYLKSGRESFVPHLSLCIIHAQFRRLHLQGLSQILSILISSKSKHKCASLSNGIKDPRSVLLQVFLDLCDSYSSGEWNRINKG
jgi:hypothetical protein